MDHAARRVRIRALVADGHLPRQGELIPQHCVTPPLPDAVCLVCGEAAPQVTYVSAGGGRMHLHAACDALRLTIGGSPP
jgi:hypothetical protein